MIFINGKCLVGSIIIFALFIILLSYCAVVAYRDNAKQESDDPERKDYASFSPWVTPITPFLWLGRMIILSPWSMVFGIFLIIFPIILLFFRPISNDNHVKKFILVVGNSVLRINTRFLYGMGIQTKPVHL